MAFRCASWRNFGLRRIKAGSQTPVHFGFAQRLAQQAVQPDRARKSALPVNGGVSLQKTWT